MASVDELLDALMKDCKKPEDIIGENGLLKHLTKRVLERAMQAEMTDHLGYEKHSQDGNNSGGGDTILRDHIFIMVCHHDRRMSRNPRGRDTTEGHCSASQGSPCGCSAERSPSRGGDEASPYSVRRTSRRSS